MPVMASNGSALPFSSAPRCSNERESARIIPCNSEALRASTEAAEARPDGELDGFVDALATRIASFDKWSIANTKRLVNAASLPPDVEITAGWDACMASIVRPAAQHKLKALFRGFIGPETQKIVWDSLSVLRATHVDDAPPIIGAGARSP